MSNIHFQRYTGTHILSFLDEVARLRIEVFREYPYLYAGSLDYEERYLERYSASPESVFVIVRDIDRIVGVSTGIPLDHEVDAFRHPFVEHGYEPDHVFYFGESVLLRPYRGQGIGVRFFQEREAHARDLGRFDYTAFSAVDRPIDHPRRPSDYVPLDRFWEKRGYTRHPELTTTYSWKDLDEESESPKRMVFWLKHLRASA